MSVVAGPSDETLPGATLIHSMGSPSCVVNGVNVISGDYMEARRDISIEDAAPLALESYYNSTSMLKDSLEKSWRHNHQGGGYLILEDSREDSTGCRLGYREPSGSTTRYVAKYPKGDNGALIKMSLWMAENRGITNCYQEIGGHTNYKNCTFSVTKAKRDIKKIEAQTSGGSKVEFNIFAFSRENDKIHRQTFWKALFHPTRESRPNRQSLLYTYENKRIKQVTSTDANGQVINWLYFSYGEMKTNPLIAVTSSDGRQAFYRFTLILDPPNGELNHWRLTQTVRSDGPAEFYNYIPTDTPGHFLLSCVSKPEGRHTIIDYYPKYKYPVKSLFSIAPKKDIRDLIPQSRFSMRDADALMYEFQREKAERDKQYPKEIVNRVRSLKAPVGGTLEALTTHTFSYDVKSDESGTTAVYDALGRLTTYDYNKDHRLESINRFSAKQLHSMEVYTWGKQGSINESNILSKKIIDHKKQLILSQWYGYDMQGNAIAETLCGNLSGHLKEGDKDECYQKTYTYSGDAYHLVTSESEEGGLRKTLFSYDTNSNLLLAKFVCENNAIRKREYYVYNAQAVVILKISDDGISKNPSDLTGVTERQITYITPKAQMPGIGLPEVVITKYLDLATGTEKLLSRIINIYSQTGKLIRQDHYDSNDQFAYKLLWQYDSFGHVTFEQDALGNTITRSYDANGNLITEQGPRPGFQKVYTYDCANRLMIEEEHFNGTRLITAHGYDLIGNHTVLKDPYGQITLFAYNDFNQLIKTTLPPLIDEQGKPFTPTTSTEYDILGYVSKTTDAQGYSTVKYNTVRGTPYAIHYPEGTKELFRYTLSGLLHSHTSRTGIVTVYTYDYLDRITQEDTLSSAGQLLKRTSHTYNAYHLLSTTDPDGSTTHYTYDGAGRLASKTKEERTITYTYDTLGRKYKETDSYGSTVYLYDTKGQLIQEQTQDLTGTLLIATQYQYDEEGNRTHVIQGASVTTTEYDCRHQPTAITDALGHTTHITYNHNHINKYQQKVLQKTTTDPLGQQTLITYDTHGKESLLEKYSPYGDLLSREKRTYDSCNRLIHTSHTVIAPQETDSTFITKWEYNSMGQVTHLAEAIGTPEEKHTRYHYNIYGQKDKIIKPNGIHIAHTYDPLGRLSTVQSSDNTISYRYTYNLLDLPTQVEDLLNHTITYRNYNHHAEVIQETLAHGYTLSYDYALNGKVQTITLPDHSTIHYAYDAAFLRKVSYKEMTHAYQDYDLAGNLLLSHSPIGEIIYKRDLLNRPIDISAPHFTQTDITYDAIGNLLSCIDRNTHCTYSYDPLYQLKSEEGTSNHQYTHDSLHNRRKKDSTPYQINALNQLTAQGEHTYRYDPNGNLIKIDETITCSYDAWDRLITLKQDDKTYHYTYDAFNRRLTNNHTHYIYTNQCEIGSYQNQQLQELRILGEGLGAEIGAAIAIYLQGQPYIPIHDHNGNISVLVDASTNTPEHYHYSAFGEENTTSPNPWRFASKRKDPDTGWIAFGRRDYDPTIGRWLTPDPQGFEDGPNLYAYLHNSPLTHFDLWGCTSLGMASASLGERYTYSSNGTSSPGPFLFGTNSGTYFNAFRSAVSGVTNGLMQGFLNPLETGSEWLNQGKNIYNGSFATSWNQMSFNDRVYYGSKCLGEAAGLWINAASTIGLARSFVRQGMQQIPKIGSAMKSMLSKPQNMSAGAKHVAGSSEKSIANEVYKHKSKGSHPKMLADSRAQADHTVLDYQNGKIVRYETFQRPTYPNAKKDWQTVKRYDATGKEHHNKYLKKDIFSPHVHDPQFPGKIRPAEPWEIPN